MASARNHKMLTPNAPSPFGDIVRNNIISVESDILRYISAACGMETVYNV